MKGFYNEYFSLNYSAVYPTLELLQRPQFFTNRIVCIL